MIRTFIRNRIRRWLGLQHWEQLQLEELRGVRRHQEVTDLQVDRVTRNNAARIRDIRDTREAVSAQGARHNSVRREVEEMGMLLRQYIDALGPMWRTAEGHSMPLRLLSTAHLRNIRAGGFGNYETSEFIDEELRRRSIDADWRAREAAGEKPPTKADYMVRALRTAAKDSPTGRKPRRQVTRAEHARIKNVLPAWAQQLIRELGA